MANGIINILLESTADASGYLPRFAPLLSRRMARVVRAPPAPHSAIRHVTTTKNAIMARATKRPANTPPAEDGSLLVGATKVYAGEAHVLDAGLTL